MPEDRNDHTINANQYGWIPYQVHDWSQGGRTLSIMEKIKTGLRSWLNIQTAAKYSINIMEMADFELSAIMNRIWYRGDSNELDQLYAQCNSYADKYKFWASHSSPGMEIRKLHIGIPHLIVRILGSIVLADMNDFDFDDAGAKQLWNAIDEENHLRSLLEEVLKDVLVVGDGAFKVTFDTTLSQYPILEWYPGDQIELTYNRKRLQEVIFKTPYKAKGRQYVLCEHYGKGYIRNELYAGENMVPLDTLEQTKGLSDWTFDEDLMMAIPFRVYKSAKYEGRGGSIFDSKLDSFDAVDEAWSQWMDALRAGRAKTYIPESCIPRDPETGTFLQPNAFDNRFIASGDNMAEGGKNQINTEQPAIPHESYLASYITALDLCLQGIISPSTLGIDTKKLDNAEAQREKREDNAVYPQCDCRGTAGDTSAGRRSVCECLASAEWSGDEAGGSGYSVRRICESLLRVSGGDSIKGQDRRHHEY